MTHIQSDKQIVVIGLLGSKLDASRESTRWDRWRPTVSIFQQPGPPIARLELLHASATRALARTVVADIHTLSPTTVVRPHVLDLGDPWDFEEVYAALHDFADAYPFDPDRETYWIHLTTGTHVMQICWFLLAESRAIPARLLQTQPGVDRGYSLVDLDLARYDRIASRRALRRAEAVGMLKSGIATRNKRFNQLIDRIEQVALTSTGPMLFTGPTGAGKSQLVRRIHALKRERHQLAGPFIEVNCATLRGDLAMSTLFGHERGAYTGAERARTGLLRAADGGLLFLDEIGELGADEQAMLLRAIEDKRFLPVGADAEVSSDFQLVAGTNRRLHDTASFRADLLARIDLWTFDLPGLRDRPEDIAPNLDHELAAFAERTGRTVRLRADARERFLAWATGPDAAWKANFRDLNAAVVRMATLAVDGLITVAGVDEEIARLAAAWSGGAAAESRVQRLFGATAASLDRFDRVQLEDVLAVCAASPSLSAAGRALFAASRAQKASKNDADRLRKYLARFGLSAEDVLGTSD